MTTHDSSTNLPEASGPPGPPRFSRRKAILGLAATALVAALGLAGVASGRNSGGKATPPASPGASPAASPGASPSASPSASPIAGPQVTISNFSFMPAALQVAVGTEVRWTNQDDIPHTVTSNDGASFASPLLDTDDQFRHRFTKPGTYAYHCALHPFMTAKVIVK